MNKKIFRKIIKCEKGQAIVEMALILPILLLFLGAILDFGWIFANTYRAEYAAGVGARYATVHAADNSVNLEEEVHNIVLENVWTDEAHTETEVISGGGTVTVNVESSVKTLTFVANTIFGDYYTTSCSATAAN